MGYQISLRRRRRPVRDGWRARDLDHPVI
jgi:hypothetical protein